jgi:flap endonuclease-1
LNAKQQGRLDGFFTVKPKSPKKEDAKGKGKGKDDAKGKGVKRKASFSLGLSRI